MQNLESEKSIESWQCPAFANSPHCMYLHILWYSEHSSGTNGIYKLCFLIQSQRIVMGTSHIVQIQVYMWHKKAGSNYSVMLHETAGNSYYLVVELICFSSVSPHMFQLSSWESFLHVCMWAWGRRGRKKQKRRKRDGPITCSSICNPSFCFFGVEAQKCLCELQSVIGKTPLAQMKESVWHH